MTAVLGSFLQLSIKFIFFVIIAVLGVICGKKLRISKDAKLDKKN